MNLYLSLSTIFRPAMSLIDRFTDSKGEFSDPQRHLLALLRSASDGENQLLGRKKLMKLVFFAEYWDHERDELLADENLNSFTDFIIYKFGPFSEDLLHTFDSVKDIGLVTEDRPAYGPIQIQLSDKGQEQAEKAFENLEPGKRNQLNKVVQKFAHEDGERLEEESLYYLDILREEKENLRGTPVNVIITEKQYA